MANKLPWFTHDHDARNDEFIQALMDEFGHFGYAGYFMLLEVIHEHGVGGNLRMKQTRLGQNLRSRWPQVRLLLDFCRTSGKVEYILSGDEVELHNKKFIERQRKLKSNAPPMLHQCSTNAPIERERDIEREGEIDRGSAKMAHKFLPPTVEELKAYSSEIGYLLNCDLFHDSYEQKGWMVGKNKMKCWKAAVRKWKQSGWGRLVETQQSEHSRQIETSRKHAAEMAEIMNPSEEFDANAAK